MLKSMKKNPLVKMNHAPKYLPALIHLFTQLFLPFLKRSLSSMSVGCLHKIEQP